jgi:transcriptional regulator with XRE-family HTH domain
MKAKKSVKHLEEQQAKVFKQIGARIKSLRIKKGYTSYEDFAYEHNISRSQFGKYERGADMRASSLVKVMAALGVTVAEFFSEGFD